MGNAIKVYSISEADRAALQQIAREKYRTESLSALARMLLLAELDKPRENVRIGGNEKVRTELRLPAEIYAHLQSEAAAHGMTAAGWITLLLHSRIRQKPLLSTAELGALYTSNYYLLSIGRNLNQIARHLNSGSSAAFTTRQVAELNKAIAAHTEKIGNVLRTADSRYQKQ